MLQRRKILQYHTNKYNIHMYNFRLVLYVWVLSIIGILVINSAADGFAAKQLIGFVGGSVVMIIFSLIDYNYIAKFEWFLCEWCQKMVFIGAFWYFPAIRTQQGDHADYFCTSDQ